MNENNYGNGMNNGVPPVQGNPGMQQPMNNMQQPMQQPVQGYGQPMQQPMQPQFGSMPGQVPVYQPPIQKKKLGTGAIIGIVLVALVVLYVVYNKVLIKTLSCETVTENAGAKITMQYEYKKRFNKPYSAKMTVIADLTNYDEEEGYLSKEKVKQALGLEDEDPCEDYKDGGCSYKSSTVGDKTTLSFTLKGKALDKYLEDNDVDEEKFVDFDKIKEDVKDEEHTTCK